jgi:hypothetical protein
VSARTVEQRSETAKEVNTARTGLSLQKTRKFKRIKQRNKELTFLLTDTYDNVYLDVEIPRKRESVVTIQEPRGKLVPM